MGIRSNCGKYIVIMRPCNNAYILKGGMGLATSTSLYAVRSTAAGSCAVAVRSTATLTPPAPPTAMPSYWPTVLPSARPPYTVTTCAGGGAGTP